MSSYKKYFDPAQVESDQKDLIISQLKAELFELRQNERDYSELHTKLNNLEHRYNLLQEEKTLNERDFKARNEINSKTVQNLKFDCDGLKNELNALNGDLQDLRIDNNGINELINSRSAEIARLKAELADLFDSNNALQGDKRDLENAILRTKDECRKLEGDLNNSNVQGNELADKKQRLEKTIKDLEFDLDKIDGQNAQLQKTQDGLRIEIKNKNDNLRYAEQQLTDQKKHILGLEADLQDLKRAQEKLRYDAQTVQKNQENEYAKNLDAQAKLDNLGRLIADRENQIADLKRQYEGLKREHLDLVNSNDDLNHDIDAQARHLELLTAQNIELVNELEKYSEQDERARAILDRRDRVNELRAKTEGRMKQSYSNMNSSLRSPGKQRDI
mmetsp:Transcript_39528/g.45983  ORF Transcript_39528/g.45983 Transcript_39528/m.45983 type:complete len:389 (+) Transcript_39528:51-1217(+)